MWSGLFDPLRAVIVEKGAPYQGIERRENKDQSHCLVYASDNS